MNRAKTAVVYNPAARRRVIARVKQSCQDVPDTSVFPVQLFTETIASSFQQIVVVGGDGTVKFIVEMIMPMNEKPALIIAAGGTENGLHKSLVDAEAAITPGQLKDLHPLPTFRPGIIRDPSNGIEKGVFNHVLTWGKITTEHIHKNEQWRKYPIPRTLRGKAAALWVTIPEICVARSDVPFIQLALTGPYFASIRLLTVNHLFTNDISLVSLEAENRRELIFKLLRFSSAVMLRKLPPEAIATVKRQPEHIIASNQGFMEINTDDELLRLDGEKSLQIERSNQQIPIVALML